MIIAIASGKGGTGKTTIATSLAIALSASGNSVSCMDCDVEAPNAHLFLKPVGVVLMFVSFMRS
jgi:MinD superfamily P-loop ATPase